MADETKEDPKSLVRKARQKAQPKPPESAAESPIARLRKDSAPAAAKPATPPRASEPRPPPAKAPSGPTRAVTTKPAAKEVADAMRSLGSDERRKAVKSQLDLDAIPAGAVKAPEWDVPKTASPAPPKATTETVDVAVKPEEEKDEGEAAQQKGPEEDDIEDEPEIFPLTEDDEQLDYYPVNPPHAFVQIVFNNKEKETRYRVIEPQLTRDERKVLKFLEDTMVDVLDAAPEDIQDGLLEDYLSARFEEIVFDYAIDLGEDEVQEAETKAKLMYYLRRDFIGEGRIDVMMRDLLIEDISCDGPHQPVFLYHRKHESVKSSVKFRDDDELDSFVIRMAQRAGKHVSIAEPILDATMPDGSRLQATLAREVSAHGSTFTIRKFRPEPFTPPDLVRFGTLSAEMLAYWWLAIQHGASAIYAGGTASGKTTGLNAILLFIPPQMKIVSIEDTREINLPHPNWIAGITRGGFGPRDESGRQAGEIDMFQLLKNALRQRPEYIVVGEVRGKEAYNLFQAMATGHAAYGTMHADSVDAVIHRLESDPINIPRTLLAALDIISIQIQTRVGGKRVRRTKQLSEIVGLDPHTQEILTNEVFRWVPKDDAFKYSGVSYVLERIQVEKGMSAAEMKQELENRVEIIRFLIKHDVRNYRDVGRIVSTYYKDPKQMMEIIRRDEPWK